MNSRSLFSSEGPIGMPIGGPIGGPIAGPIEGPIGQPRGRGAEGRADKEPRAQGPRADDQGPILHTI